MITIYHNPRCSKSRQTLEILQDKGISPEIVLYLNTPLEAATLKNLLQSLNMSPRELLRTWEADYKDNNLKDPGLTNQQLIDFMIQYPKLIERPIVVKGDKAVIGRPPENVLTLL